MRPTDENEPKVSRLSARVTNQLYEEVAARARGNESVSKVMVRLLRLGLALDRAGLGLEDDEPEGEDSARDEEAPEE